MTKRTVGIITFHCSYNYGSVLQAYALQEYISSLGFNVFVINYKDIQDFSQYELFRVSSYITSPKSLLSDIVFLGKHVKRKNSFEQFIYDNLKLTDKFNKEMNNNDLECNSIGEIDIYKIEINEKFSDISANGVKEKIKTNLEKISSSFGMISIVTYDKNYIYVNFSVKDRLKNYTLAYKKN